MTDIKSQIAEVNSLLHAGEPENVSVDTYSGYSGYKPQYIIDALNQVFDIGSWGFEEISNQVEAGEKGGLAIAQVQVWFKDIEFRPTGYGQARVTKGDIGDAKKGAQTDALKKALSYFSIGKRAYLGLLITEKSSNNNQRQAPQQQRPAPQQSRPQPQQDVKPVQTNASTCTITSSVVGEREPVSIAVPTTKTLYETGGKKGMWKSSQEFYSSISHMLTMPVGKDTKLTQEQRIDLAKQIEAQNVA